MRTTTPLRAVLFTGLLGLTAMAAEPLQARVEDWLSRANTLSGACGQIEWNRVDVLGAVETNGTVTLNLSRGFHQLGDRTVREQAARCLAATLSGTNTGFRIRVEGHGLDLVAQSAPAATAQRSDAPTSYRVVLNPVGGMLSDGTPAVAGMDGGMNAETAMSLTNLIGTSGVEVIPTRQADKRDAGWKRAAVPYLESIGVDQTLLEQGRTLAEQDQASRALYANSMNAQLLVNVDAGGAERTLRVYYSPDGANAASSRIWAQRIHDTLLAQLQQQFGSSWTDGGVIACAACSSENRLAAMPAVFVETGGGTTPAVVSPRYRMAAGSALRQAIKSDVHIMAGGTPASLSAPTPGSTLTGSSATFTWSAVSGATDYYLFVGNWVGGNTLFGRDMGLLNTYTVTGLPTDGRTFYVRLWSYINGAWASTDATYTAFTSSGSTPTASKILTPTPGSTLGSSSVTFTWDAGSAVVNNYLFVGRWAGDNSLFSGDVTGQGTQTITSLPADGTMLYVRLWSYINGVWRSNDYTFMAANTAGPPAAATLVSPAPGSTLSGPTATFTWNRGSAVTRYWLQVGYWTGGETLYSKDEVSALSDTINGIPTDGRNIYVRLWSFVDSAWVSTDAVYTAASASGTPTKAMIQSPAPGSTISSGATTFTWDTGKGVSEYYLFVGTSAGANDIYSKAEGTKTTDTVTLPANKAIFVRLWSYINGAYSAADFAYQTGN